MLGVGAKTDDLHLTQPVLVVAKPRALFGGFGRVDSVDVEAIAQLRAAVSHVTGNPGHEIDEIRELQRRWQVEQLTALNVRWHSCAPDIDHRRRRFHSLGLGNARHVECDVDCQRLPGSHGDRSAS